jgi:hypothetical protein
MWTYCVRRVGVGARVMAGQASPEMERMPPERRAGRVRAREVRAVVRVSVVGVDIMVGLGDVVVVRMVRREGGVLMVLELQLELQLFS